MLHEGHKPVISTSRELDALQIGALHEGQKPITDRGPCTILCLAREPRVYPMRVA